MWGLIDTDPAEIALTVVGRGARASAGLSVHRVTTMSEVDVRLHTGLPVTAPARTLVDLAGVLDEHELEAALALTLRNRLANLQEVAAAMSRIPYAKGTAGLRQMLDDVGTGATEPQLTRSKYERKLLALIGKAALPRPRANQRVNGMEVDLLWPDQRVVVEFDSFAFHSSRRSFERDRLKTQKLTAAGYRVIRITARQLDLRPEATIAMLAAALAVV